MSVPAQPPRVAIVGGGLAGLAAAVALSGAACRVELFESRRQLGGRASSFRDLTTDQWIDNCQHVSMGCCTNLADFARRTGTSDYFQGDDVLNFVAADGRLFTLQASRWLPAPLHLAPALFRLKYLSLRERLGIASAMWRLMRQPCGDTADGPTIAAWLQRSGQSARAIHLFWEVVLVSALGETLDRASLSAARKVFVDGFMMSRRAYRIEVPRRPLSEIYGERLEAWLAEHGTRLHFGVNVKQVTGSPAGVRGIVLADGSTQDFDFVIAAAPWRRLPGLLAPELQAALPWLAGVEAIQSAPITGIHLWFDRPITSLPHAVLVGRLGQWLFNRGAGQAESDNAGPHSNTTKEFYYQVVISGSREMAAISKQAVIEQVRSELAGIWPAARGAQLLRARVVTDPLAVFSVQPGLESLRPAQRTAVPGLLIAGDWTRTGWPATMESAVRSGYQAAEGVLQAIGSPKRLLVADLSPGWLARWLIKRD